MKFSQLSAVILALGANEVYAQRRWGLGNWRGVNRQGPNRYNYNNNNGIVQIDNNWQGQNNNQNGGNNNNNGGNNNNDGGNRPADDGLYGQSVAYVQPTPNANKENNDIQNNNQALGLGGGGGQPQATGSGAVPVPSNPLGGVAVNGNPNADAFKDSASGVSLPDAAGPVDNNDIVAGRGTQYLYVWAGADGRVKQDRVITFNFDPYSPYYGKPVSQALVPTSGNEPHHCGISKDRRSLVCGGFLSFMKRQDEIYYFDLSNPAYPRYAKSYRGIAASVPDEFIALEDNTFILSEMGKYDGSSPGRVARLNSDGSIIAEYPPNPPQDFNPHGMDIRKDLNIFVTSDYLNALSALYYTGNADPIVRSSLRVWNLQDFTMSNNTIYLPAGTGTMDMRLMKRDPQGRGYVGGTGDGKIYFFNPFTFTAELVIDVADIVNKREKMTAGMMQILADDSKIYILYASAPDNTGKPGHLSGIGVYDITRPERPRLVQNMVLPAYAAPHLIHIKDRRLVVTDYFLDMDNFGKVHADGDRFVRVFNIQPNGYITVESRFQINFSRLVYGVQLRPHGLGWWYKDQY